MECSLCSYPYDEDKHRPKILASGHTLCTHCLLPLLGKGQYTNPFEGSVCYENTLEEFKDNFAIIESIQGQSLPCQTHKKNARRFCVTHLKVICEKCSHSPLSECQVKDVHDNRTELMHMLLDDLKLKGRNDDYPASTMPKMSQPYELSLADLVSVLTTIRGIEKGCCERCKSLEFSYIDRQNYCLYCKDCVHFMGETLTEMDVIDYTESDTDTKSVIWAKLREVVKKMDFWALSKEQIQFLAGSGECLYPTFLSNARKILKKAAVGKQPIPEQFVCAGCFAWNYPGKSSLRKLFCASATHTLCVDCLKARLKDHEFRCPLDGQLYHADDIDLFPIFPKLKPGAAVYETPDGNEPPPSYEEVVEIETSSRLVKEDHALVHAGTLIPPSIQPDNLPAPFIGRKLTTLSRFKTVLPAMKKLAKDVDNVFEKPWGINRFLNQVEVVSFSSFENVSIWAIGLANPIKLEDIGIVEFIKMFKGYSATGQEDVNMRLWNKELPGGKSVITDIYFEEPYVVYPAEVYTLKIKLGRPQGSDESEIPIFHGNHLGAYEDPVAEDGSLWAFMRPQGVEVDEEESGQNELIGPILRFLFSQPS